MQSSSPGVLGAQPLALQAGLSSKKSHQNTSNRLSVGPSAGIIGTGPELRLLGRALALFANHERRPKIAGATGIVQGNSAYRIRACTMANKLNMFLIRSVAFFEMKNKVKRNVFGC